MYLGRDLEKYYYLNLKSNLNTYKLRQIINAQNIQFLNNLNNMTGSCTNIR